MAQAASSGGGAASGSAPVVTGAHGEAVVGAGEHCLKHTWVLWEMRQQVGEEKYRETVVPILEFSTVEEFWRKWEHAPRVSAVLSGPEGPATITRRVPDTENEWRTSKVHGYQLFKKGIRPFMESTDETTGERHNKARLRSDQNKLKRGTDAYKWDKIWETLVLLAIGESLDGAEIVNGVVVQDKSRNKAVLYRLEVWVSDAAPKTKLPRDLTYQLGIVYDDVPLKPFSVVTR